MASFQSMYGIRLSRDLGGMKWREFSAFIAGLNRDTPLGKVVAIRAEEDPARLREFTPEMRRIRSAWRSRKAKEMPQQRVTDFLESMKKAFLALAGESEAVDEKAVVP